MGGENIFVSLQKLILQIHGLDEVCIDNLVFKLHRIVTVTLLLAFSAVLSLSQVRIKFNKSKQSYSMPAL